MQIRCNFPDISYLSEMQKNNFQFLNDSQSAYSLWPLSAHQRNAIHDKWHFTGGPKVAHFCIPTGTLLWYEMEAQRKMSRNEKH